MVGFHRAAGLVDGFEAGAAQAVHGRSRNGVGESGKQRGVARYVARILARLIGATEVDVFDLFFVDTGFLDELGDDVSGQVVGADVFEDTAVTPRRRAHGLYDNGFFHDFTLPSL